MARARNIKPGFFKNEDLAECSPWARLCFIGLWTLSDREGLLEDRPKRIKAELFAFDSIEVEPLLAELAARGFIVRYPVDGLSVISIPTFLKHQNPHHREQASELPPPPSPGLESGDMNQKPEAFSSMDSKPEASTPSHGGKAGLIPSSLNPSSLIPESMPGGADAPAAELVTEGQIWQAGIDLLGKANMAETQARAFLGKLTKDHGKEAVHAAVGSAVAEQPVDPRAYLRAACSRSVGARQSYAQQDDQRARGRAAEFMGRRPQSTVRRTGFEDIDYTEGVKDHGHLV
jgi:hypothetical protein